MPELSSRCNQRVFYSLPISGGPGESCMLTQVKKHQCHADVGPQMSSHLGSRGEGHEQDTEADDAKDYDYNPLHKYPELRVHPQHNASHIVAPAACPQRSPAQAIRRSIRPPRQTVLWHIEHGESPPSARSRRCPGTSTSLVRVDQNSSASMFFVERLPPVCNTSSTVYPE